MSRTQLTSTDLQAFQLTLEKDILEDKYVPDFETEKLLCYDELQRSFVDNGKGTGRLAWKKFANFTALCGEEYNRKVLLSCFVGPTRNEVVKQIEEIFAMLKHAESKTPWQLHSQDPNYSGKIDSLCCNDFFLGQFAANLLGISQIYYRTKTQSHALLVTIAILRYKNDNNRFPSSLDELVSAGYLQTLPLDPYSNGALVYRPKGDSFTLYSVGENFIDDGGTEPNRSVSTLSGDIVFWPVKNFEQRMKRLDESKDVNTPAE